ncbi:hypothetical protein MHH33_17545 [Paenisporosarcina sp. FSL H8-0542]|uniref:hypothetical protein n=1 Tax=Paenisporosarcina sp. FSL H8-0542 TaxID=2921401 RepID=UPI00315B024B
MENINADEAISEQIVRGVFWDAWENPEKLNNGKKLSTLMIEWLSITNRYTHHPEDFLTKMSIKTL